MLSGIIFTAGYIIYFKFINPSAGADQWWFGISPEGIGTVGMMVNFCVAIAVSRVTAAPPQEVVEQVESLRYPKSD